MKRNSTDKPSQAVQSEMEQIVEQGQIESICDVQVGDNLVEKLQAAVLVRDGVIEAIEAG
jgi:gamma-glutamyl-gamma-aminobutyrate hydrolase PuuD